jgi:hypothetical protein
MVIVSSSEERSQLRGAIARRDGAEVVELLTGRLWPVDALQLIGDGLLVALSQQVDGAAPLTEVCVSALRARGWSGDEELADMLQAPTGGAPHFLRPLTVDLEELAMVLEGDPVHGGGRIDLRTGEVWPQSAIDYAIEVGEEKDDEDDDPDRWLWVGCEGSHAAYGDMEWFIADLAQPQVADRLNKAISGRGAFRRFKDALFSWPDLKERWHGFSEDRQRGRARSWLADQGYAASPPASTTRDLHS